MTFLLPPGIKELLIWEIKLNSVINIKLSIYSKSSKMTLYHFCRIFVIYGTKYWRMDQVNFFKDCLPQILLVFPLLNTLSQILFAFWEFNSHLGFSKFNSMQSITSGTLSSVSERVFRHNCPFFTENFTHINITVKQKWGTNSMF